MDKDNVFDGLVKDLSSEERRKMIEKMEQNIHVSHEPMGNVVENELFQSIDDVYASLSWLDKLIIFIQSLFLAKERNELTKKHMVKGLSRQVETVSSEFFDVKHGAANGEFCRIIRDLYKSAEKLKAPLTVCFGVDKVKFYSLMGQLEFPAIYDELVEKIDPLKRGTLFPNMDSQAIRKAVSEDLESLLAMISRENRLRMMETTRVLNSLYQLSVFPYQQILSQFPDSPDGSILAAGFSSIKEPLSELAVILKSFINPPGIKLLEAVFLLYYSSETEEGALSLEERVSRGIESCEVLFQKIREFNSRIPLSDLLRVMHEDPFYSIPNSGGGEDWFYHFRQYWVDRQTDLMHIFSREKKLEEFISELKRYWDLPSLEFIPDYTPDSKHSAFAWSLGVLNTFYNENYQKKLYFPMKIILVDGNFYKKNNREDFEKTFQSLVKFGDRIKWFASKLVPEGEAGRQIRELSHEFRSNPEELDKQVLGVHNRLNRDAQIFLEDAIDTLVLMGKLMNGIVMGNGGTYDTLANFSELGGRNNEDLRKSVAEAADDIHKINHSLQDIFNLEKEKMDELVQEERG